MPWERNLGRSSQSSILTKKTQKQPFCPPAQLQTAVNIYRGMIKRILSGSITNCSCWFESQTAQKHHWYTLRISDIVEVRCLKGYTRTTPTTPQPVHPAAAWQRYRGIHCCTTKQHRRSLPQDAVHLPHFTLKSFLSNFLYSRASLMGLQTTFHYIISNITTIIFLGNVDLCSGHSVNVDKSLTWKAPSTEPFPIWLTFGKDPP